ncbi:hypothetical protein E2P81_ATG00207 [Venturia nashicola]|uniref:BHLH domain-containing protein n=1 Tax=Venturia nashicola TaxID=86259 RepID=A0A4Z1PVK7_9PEZI|nr:hypothetical protein E6O75_ATG00217 [Venturia nashicola]TLD39220.1 hypothetical protein E2P81_ATG00207 [Venturia nashicola]
MEFKSEIFSNSWRAVYPVETQTALTNVEDIQHARLGIYGSTPDFIRPKSNSVLDDFCAGLDPHYKDLGLFQDINPQYLIQVDSSDNVDYFSRKAHSTTHLSPKPHRSPFGTISKSLPPSAKDSHMKITKRKPGRPRTVFPCDTASTSSASPTNATVRMPHNQVERKYRQSLNAEMARLRVAIPKIAEWDTDPKATVKPSKAMVLASAVSYIQELEKERDELKRRNCFL